MTDNATHLIINQIDSFPELPSTVSKVMKITSDPESSAEELMQAILPDQSMCVTILKIANSAFFGLPRQVNTIEKAVMVLGFDEIRNIVLGKAVFNSFQKINKTSRDTIEKFWHHTFICGLAAKIIAEDLKLSASEFFIAGLIHDIGKLAMLMSLNGEYSPLLEISGPLQLRSYIQEQELFSISHDKVGSQLLDRWLFPKSLVNSVRYHHIPQEADNQLEPAIIQVADILSHNHCSPDQIDPKDTTVFIEDFMPELQMIWKDNGLDWSSDHFVRWQNELSVSSERDQAILSIITS